jgi:hypothetical protein
MRAVWSFWSKPFRAQKGRSWLSPLHHFLAWGLSVRLARKHFPETMLVTDTPGKALLVDSLGLSFTHVSTELDNLRHVDSGWWALGKLVAYRMQQQPFIHLDTDVFLWKPLPPGMIAASVFAQCREEHLVHGHHEVERAFSEQNIALPSEWEWSRSRSVHSYREANCGILGGNRVDFIQYYSGLAIDLIVNPNHAAAWQTIPHHDGHNMFVEQFLLDACFDFHRSHPQSPYRGIHMRYLFPTNTEAFDRVSAARAGYTHLLGDSKRHPHVARRLEERTQQEDPHFYRHCLQLSRRNNSSATARP